MSEKEIPLTPTPTASKPIRPQRPILAHPDGPNVATESSGGKSIIDQLADSDPEELLQWEDFWLPSKGIYYNGRIPEGKVQIKPMGLIADKIMATGRLVQTFQSIDWLFKHHVKLPEGFETSELLSTDRTFILFGLRGITHGNEYEFSITCTNDDCKRKSIHKYDLNELQNHIRGPVHTSEPVHVTLPGLTKLSKQLNYDGEIYADVRFLRGSDTRSLEQKRREYNNIRNKSVHAKNQKSEISLNQIIEDNIKLAIVSINGDTDRRKIEQMVRKMTQSDTAAIRNVIENECPGLDTEIVIACPHCENEMEMELPITETFFRPEALGGMRE
jgi:hypothetical protein